MDSVAADGIQNPGGMKMGSVAAVADGLHMIEEHLSGALPAEVGGPDTETHHTVGTPDDIKETREAKQLGVQVDETPNENCFSSNNGRTRYGATKGSSTETQRGPSTTVGPVWMPPTTR